MSFGKPDAVIKAWAWSKGDKHGRDEETLGEFLKSHPEILKEWIKRCKKAIRDFLNGDRDDWSCLITLDHFVNAVADAKSKNVQQFINDFSKCLAAFLIANDMLQEVDESLVKAFQKGAPEPAAVPKKNDTLPEQFRHIGLEEIVQALGLAETTPRSGEYYAISNAADVTVRALAEFLRANPKIHSKMKRVVSKHLEDQFGEVEPDEEPESKPSKLKIPQDMTAYFTAVVDTLHTWGENVEPMLKISDLYHRLQNPEKKNKKASYEASIKLIAEILRQKNLDPDATKKASLSKIRISIHAGIANCVGMRGTAMEESIIGVCDTLMHIQVEFMQLQNLVVADIDVPMIRKAIWKKVRQLNNAFSKVFAQMNK